MENNIFRTEFPFNKYSFPSPHQKRLSILISICSIFKPRFLEIQSTKHVPKGERQGLLFSKAWLRVVFFSPPSFLGTLSTFILWRKLDRLWWRNAEMIDQFQGSQHLGAAKPGGPAHPWGPLTHSPETPCGQHDREVKRAVNWLGFFQFVTKRPLGPFLLFTLRNNKDARPGLVPSSGGTPAFHRDSPNKKARVPSQEPPTSQNKSATPPGTNARAPPRFSAAG